MLWFIYYLDTQWYSSYRKRQAKCLLLALYLPPLLRQFIYHAFHPLEVYNLIVFFSVLRVCINIKNFHYPTKKPHTVWPSLPILTPNLFWAFSINGITHYVVLCDWPLSLSTCFQGSSLLYHIYQYFIYFAWWTTIIPFHIYSSVNEHLGCLHFLAIILLLWVFMSKFLWGHMFWFLLGVYPVELDYSNFVP